MILDVGFTTTKILVVGFGEVGKKITDKIQQDDLVDVDTVFVNSGKIVLRLNQMWNPDNFNGAEMIIIVFDSAEDNEGLAYIAASAKEKGILVLGMGTKSFFPNKDEDRACTEAISCGIDALNIFYRDKTVEYYSRKQCISKKYSAERTIIGSIQQIVLMMNVPNVINIDIEDFRNFLRKAGIIQIGNGYGVGDNKADDAVRMALDSCSHAPDIRTATRWICAVFGDITLTDASDICESIRSFSGEDNDIIFGVSYDDSLEDVCYVTIIAADFVDSRVSRKQVSLDIQ
ncbi:hypothetical protein [Butyrivibrio sp. VCB2006]|uniref:hypothetical protein n=1 Tax=Butyrivibrio sp. VCB2006 TaxID=1280679 RepID=UPI0003FF172B|nr:hypothetical protein [Butyrivibrio sp. VCB2006]